MQGIRYTLKVWLSGLILTPFVYLLLLVLLPGHHIPELLGFILVVYVIPYTGIVSVWVGLSLLCVINLLRYYDLNKTRIKLSLSVSSLAIIFLGFTMLRHIPAIMMYSGDHTLPAAYVISTVIFIWIYKPKSAFSKLNAKPEIVLAAIKSSFSYSLVVWLITFLVSVPFTLVMMFFTKGFSPGSLKNGIRGIIEHYQIQLNISITFLITLFLISLAVSVIKSDPNKKKIWIILFSCLLSLPAYFFNQLFNGELLYSTILEFIVLTFPSLLISIAAIWFIRLKTPLQED